MDNCLICGGETKRKWLATFWHFRPYENGNWKWLKVNCHTFGLLSGVHSTVCLAFPIYNTFRYWKCRKSFLALPDGRPLTVAFNNNGCVLEDQYCRCVRASGETRFNINCPIHGKAP